MIDINYLVELEGDCQGILIQLYFWGNFLRKIGWFKILEIVTNPERRRRAVSPACPAKASGDGGSKVEGAKGHPDSIGTLIEYILYTNEFTVLQNLQMLIVLFSLGGVGGGRLLFEYRPNERQPLLTSAPPCEGRQGSLRYYRARYQRILLLNAKPLGRVFAVIIH